MKPGTYKAQVASHAITETKDGHPQATITFNVFIDNKNESITAFLSFKEKAVPHTMKALVACGLKGNNAAGDLEIGKDVQIVVDEEIGTDNKKRMKVKWINPIGATKNIIPKENAKARLAALEGAVVAARQEMGIKDDNESIPF